ncbi:synaptic vesicle VAT-1 family membrane protein [Leptospira ilyithenensis]|uniref:Zinc-binding dehydrogenase n=1 Tax=Leptospira ilyithenensis TaxID=2484901 RepID=A0A4R9LMW4_9LEPT|nr:medium chain dehydrogenase/reductase family protein [Leptospira ilyithenensis]TGN09838.1 zinc-binding dehydrogenase [Leptospira ilyithenensis]
MKREVYRVVKTGSLQGLKRMEEELSSPAKDEVTIQVKAIGFNFADVFSVFGLYSATPKESFIPGLEFSGIIISKGEDVKDFRIGDSVYGTTRFGAYATHLNIQKDYIFALPKAWSFEEGAAFPAQALTAYYALLPLGNLKNSQTVLIHSAAGGVGILANRIAKKWNAFTIGLVGNESKYSILQEEGFDAYLTRSKAFKQEMKRILLEKRLDLVLECTGGQYFSDSYTLLSPMGRLVTYGSAVFTPSSSHRNWFKLAYHYLTRPSIDPLSMISDNKSVMGFNLIWLWNEKLELKKHFSSLSELNLSPQRIGEVFSFDELIPALDYFRSGKTIGKVVVRVS